ncbi:MAG: protein kinase domain-containing protein, partial [Thermoanaerobaculia bacterium]
EARATGALNHPNLLVIFDIGTHDGAPYLVSELLEGESLRETLSAGRIPLRKTIDYAVQIAHGVAAAHEKGIVHRDLKPENIFITSDGRVKLLDFGLAKLIVAEAGGSSRAETDQRGTNPGTIVGTAAYMSPEQVRGTAVDQRSDIFSFGVVLYEMISGLSPFRRNSSVETMSAVLQDDAPPIIDATVPPGLVRLLQHALEKAPSRRFESMKDVAFAVDALTLSGESPSRTSRTKKSKPPERPKEVNYQRITFRRGYVMSARFAPDGSVIYGAAWEDKPLEVFSSQLSTPEPRPLGLPDADILSVSPSGELALSLGRRFTGGWTTSGTLARRPLGGGAPRPLVENVQDAEWMPDGKNLMVIRHAAGIYRIEAPIGTVVYESAMWLTHPRRSPRGDRIAFAEHPVWGDDSGFLVVIGNDGKTVVRSSFVPGSISGLAWTPKGDEVWMTAESEAGRELAGMNLSGRQRTVLAVPGRLTLHDIDAGGRVLLSFENGRREVVAGRRGEAAERNLSWFDWSWLSDLSNDGKLVLIVEQATAVRGRNTMFVRPTDGSAAVRIGEGHGRGRPFSRDASAIVMESGPGRLELAPVGAGETRLLPYPRLEEVLAWQLFPDERRLLILGNDGSRPMSLYEMALDGDGTVRRISDTKAQWPIQLSNNGETVASVGPELRTYLYSVTGGEAWPAPGCGPGDDPIGWSPDDRAIYVYRRARISANIERVDVTTGERTPWCTMAPADPAGILDIMPAFITPDGQTYAYSYRRFLSDLCVVTGLL